jgi:hypothetical protein
MAAQVLASLPWKDILKVLPALVTAATKLWDRTSSQPKSAPINPNDDPQKQLTAIIERLQYLEDSEAAQANLIKQLLEQLQGVSVGLSEISRRSNISLFLGIGAFSVSIVALVIVILR